MAKKTLSNRIGIAKKYKQNDWLQQCYLSAIESEEPISKDLLLAAGVEVDTIATLLEIRQSIYGVMCKHISSALSNAPSGSGPQPCNCGLQWAKGECPYLSYTLTAKKYGAIFYDERLGDKYLVEKDSRSAPPETSAASATPVAAPPKLKKKSGHSGKPISSPEPPRSNGILADGGPLSRHEYEQADQGHWVPTPHSLPKSPFPKPQDRLRSQASLASTYDPSPYGEGSAMGMHATNSWPEGSDGEASNPSWGQTAERVISPSRSSSPIPRSDSTNYASTKNWPNPSATQTTTTVEYQYIQGSRSGGDSFGESGGSERSSSLRKTTKNAPPTSASASDSSKKPWGGFGQFVAGTGSKSARG